MKAIANQLTDTTPYERGEALVAIKNHAIAAEGESSLLHLLHKRPVRPIGILQRVNDLFGRGTNNDRIDLAVTNGIEGLVGFAKLIFQFRKTRVQPLITIDRAHDFVSAPLSIGVRFRPASTLS